jgi:polar amino acid transport system permease protein
MGPQMIDFNLLLDSLPALTWGAFQSVQIACCSSIIGLLLGGILGVTQVYGSATARGFTTLYVTVVRGTPMLVQLFFVFYAWPQMGLSLTPFQAAVVAIGLNSAAYVSQMVRSGLQAVPQGQLEAARLLGIPFHKQLRCLIFPQTLTICWPALGNELVTLIKDSSLASIVGVMELTKQGAVIRSRSFDAFTVLLGVALFYLAMTVTVQILWDRWEKRSKLCYE